MKHKEHTFLLILLIMGVSSAGCAPSGPVLRGNASDPDACQENRVRNLLRGHPGVDVREAGGVIRLRIRGSLREPLFVVDGLPMEPHSGDVLSSINPCDIQDVRVLTSTADLAIFGLRGGAGVVLITTKGQ